MNPNAERARRPIVAAAVLAAALSAPAHALSNLVVHVVNSAGGGVAGARVAALFFNNGQPDPVATRVGVADASGNLTFDGVSAPNLVASDYYQVVATSQGFLPSLVDQFNAGAPGLAAAAPSATPPSITITISSVGVNGVGEIDAAINGASHNALLFGQLGLQAGGGAVAYAYANTDGSGAGTMQIFNVAYASAGTYQINSFDPATNRSANTQVNGNLNAGTTPLGGYGLYFATAAPPVANIGQSQSPGQTGNGLSVYGVMTDTNSAAIPFLGLSFQAQYKDAYGQTQYDFRGSNTDQNGVFQLYGLLTGVTYYAFIPGGCASNGACYMGVQSTAVAGGFGSAPGANDFLYKTTATVLTPTIQLSQIPAPSGKIAVYVKDQFGNLFPQANVGVFPDGTPWQQGGGPCSSATWHSNPAFVNSNTNAATGYALITGVPSGNVSLYAWTPYGQTDYSAGPDGTRSTSGCFGSSLDDLRVTIDTNSALGGPITSTNGPVGIYDIYGNIVSTGLASITVTVKVSTGSTGAVQMTLNFPSSVDLSSSPISVVLYPQCNSGGNCNGSGGFHGLSGVVSATTTFSIPVSSGQAYWMNILSNYWGAVFPGGNQPQPDLTASTSAAVSVQMQPAGRILGYMRKPDGSIYVPATTGGNNAPNVNAEGNSSWGNTQVNRDGSFTIGGLLPGSYFLQAQNYGQTPFPYTAKPPFPSVSVLSNQDTNQDLYLADAVSVQPLVNLVNLPPLTVGLCSGNGNGDCPAEDWKAFALPAGSPLTGPAVMPLLTGGGGRNPGEFDYSASTGQVNRCNGQFLAAPGFCTSAMATGKSGSAFDFYLMRAGNFDSNNLAGGVRPYFVIESSSRSVVLGPSYTNASSFNQQSNSTTSVQQVTLTPVPAISVQQAVLAGTVTATNMINAREFQQLGGNFDAFLQYLPTMFVYDTTGTLKAVGLVVPFPPTEKSFDNQLKSAVANGNYSQFQTLTGAAPSGWGALGYEIRGLTANTTYNLVLTTPNYPPYKTTVQLGAAASTTTISVNLDLNPGGSFSGVVQSTSGVAIAGAQVTVKASGYGPVTLTTANDGTWSLSGLSAGTYQILAVASGYAEAAQNADAGSSGNTTVATFSLPRSNSSITGTVYTNNPICPAGANCSALGKTALQGVTVLAYDDTINGNNPSAVLPLYRAVTNSSGAYTLSGLVTADSLGTHAYRLFVNAPGYLVANATFSASVGVSTGADFSLKPKPLDVNVYGHPVGANYEFQITNYTQFSSGKAWISKSPYVSALTPGTTEVDQTPGFVQRPDATGATQLFMDYPLASLSTGTLYVLHIEAQPNDPRAALVVKEVTFGQNLPNGVCQSIDQMLIGDDAGVNSQGLPNNLAPLDITGTNASGLSLPAGGVIPLFSTAVPSMCMSQTDATASTQATIGVTTAAFASGVYNVTLASASYAKGVDITLSYNQNNSTLGDLAVYTFDNASQKWKSVPGTQTLDPVKGTITVKGLKSLASVLSVPHTGISAAGAGGSPSGGYGLQAVFDGHSYRPAAIVLRPDDSGSFAVMRPSQVGGGSFNGTVVRVYNFPNPFNLQTKSVTLSASTNCSGGSGTVLTNGTFIKYEIPGGISGHGVIRIYTPSGRLVRELDAGDVAPNSCYYTTWDGANKNGQPVANGVYFGVLSVGGSKLSSGTFKLAVIK